jgi:hypothetical protein
MAPDPNDFIQTQIHQHGPLRAARYLTCSEYSLEHEDGFAYVVADPRAAIDGPIRSVALTHGRDQMLRVDFEQARVRVRGAFAGSRAGDGLVGFLGQAGENCVDRLQWRVVSLEDSGRPFIKCSHAVRICSGA